MLKFPCACLHTCLFCILKELNLLNSWLIHHIWLPGDNSLTSLQEQTVCKVLCPTWWSVLQGPTGNASASVPLHPQHSILLRWLSHPSPATRAFTRCSLFTLITWGSWVFQVCLASSPLSDPTHHQVVTLQNSVEPLPVPLTLGQFRKGDSSTWLLCLFLQVISPPGGGSCFHVFFGMCLTGRQGPGPDHQSLASMLHSYLWLQKEALVFLLQVKCWSGYIMGLGVGWPPETTLPLETPWELGSTALSVRQTPQYYKVTIHGEGVNAAIWWQ